MVKKALEALPDEKLELLAQLSKKGGRSEDVLCQVAAVLEKDVDLLDEGVAHVVAVKKEVLTFFFQVFAAEFSESRGQQLTYSMKNFGKEVGNALAFRRGIRQVVGAQAAEAEVATPGEASTGCAIS